MKKVLVTGILGQDGANMAEFLLRQGEPIMVYGMMRRSSNPNFVNAKNFKDRFIMSSIVIADGQPRIHPMVVKDGKWIGKIV